MLALQTRQPVFVQLLQGVFRVYHCTWLMPSQKASVESCIRVLSDVGKEWVRAELRAQARPSGTCCSCVILPQGRCSVHPAGATWALLIIQAQYKARVVLRDHRG